MSGFYFALFSVVILSGGLNIIVNARRYPGGCRGEPPAPTNGYQSCVRAKCVAYCNSGYVFYGTSSSMTMYCWRKNWYFDWTNNLSGACTLYAAPTCAPPAAITCQANQIVYQITDAAGCVTNACQCKTCVPIDQSKPLLPGLTREVKNDGCCDYEELSCKPELCPTAPVCKLDEISEEVKPPGACCSTHTCIKQEGCIDTIENGLKEEFFKVGQKWNNGPCNTCSCLFDPVKGKHGSVCTTQTCPKYDDHNFSYNITTGKECCPKVEFVACKFGGKEYAEGDTWRVEKCLTEICFRNTNGELVKKVDSTRCNTICGQKVCEATCSILGYSHYTTFNGKKFDFSGLCSYYLVQSDDFEIIGVNSPRGKSEIGLPSYIKSIIIKANGHVIKLGENRMVTDNEKDVMMLPYTVSGIKIRSVSSMFISVQLPNGLNIKWDGVFRIYAIVPPSFVGQTKGMCGKFNAEGDDDVTTENSVYRLGNDLNVEDRCLGTIPKHPCEVNPTNKAAVERLCQNLKSNIFLDCHQHINPETYYENCIRDGCSCQGDISNCMCSMIAAYADDCKSKHVTIDWRKDVTECGIQCVGGQTYKVCPDDSHRTCSDISIGDDYKGVCSEDCRCPAGEAVDENGFCVTVENCGCLLNEKIYKSGDTIVKPVEILCVCANAIWNCRKAKLNEIAEHQLTDESKCNSEKYLKFTSCKAPEQRSCKNMHRSFLQLNKGTCQPGCDCKEGFVLDTRTNNCIRPLDCPCYQGGRSYNENDFIQQACNTCTCKEGHWECTERVCAAECSAWGDSHFKTFDGELYDFQGRCDYILAKGSFDDQSSFQISIQNVACGTLGVSCLKSVTISVTHGKHHETIKLIRGLNPATEILQKLVVVDKGVFVVVEAVGMGLMVHWDKGTRVYIRIDQEWKNKVTGLCGNYNDDRSDDMQKPGDLHASSAVAFGDSWKMFLYCPQTEQIKNSCELKPERKLWSIKQCEILKSDVFAACHARIPVDLHFEKCVFDACACDSGGDCECLCTSIAAYAHECNSNGVPINWRRQNLCPIQCEVTDLQYNPCISTCPVQHCDSIIASDGTARFCERESCVEGCSPKLCPVDYVYLNASFNHCVRKDPCKLACLEIERKIYYEGDVIKQDGCQTCRCENKKQVCTGQPCETTARSCVEPIPVTCSKGQITKSVQDEDGCTKNVCDCPKCEPIDYSRQLPAGHFRLVKYNGCCMYEELICRQEFCPGPPNCGANEIANELDSDVQCCPTYECLAQGCVVTRTIGDAQKEELFEVGHAWENGPCTVCTCVLDPIEGHRSDCVTKTCPSLYPDDTNYVYNTTKSTVECCAKLERIGCKFEGKKYSEGESWYVDKCQKESCFRNAHGELVKKQSSTQCNTDCVQGYKYVNSSNTCCGACVQYGCAVGNGIKSLGENWKSVDSCTTYVCEKLDGQFVVTRYVESCPELDCPPDRVYKKGCCNYCKLSEE